MVSLPHLPHSWLEMGSVPKGCWCVEPRTLPLQGEGLTRGGGLQESGKRTSSKQRHSTGKAGNEQYHTQKRRRGYDRLERLALANSFARTSLGPAGEAQSETRPLFPADGQKLFLNEALTFAYAGETSIKIAFQVSSRFYITEPVFFSSDI